MTEEVVELRNRMRYEAIERIVRRWNQMPIRKKGQKIPKGALYPFSKMAQRRWATLSDDQLTDLKDWTFDWILSSVEALEAEPARAWRLDRQWLKGPRRFADLPIPGAVKTLRTAVLHRFEDAILEYHPR